MYTGNFLHIGLMCVQAELIYMADSSYCGVLNLVG